MDAERLSELAEDVMDLLKKYDIAFEDFNLKIVATREYYQSIKSNFPDRHPSDQIVTTKGENWDIQIMYSLYRAGGTDTQQSQ